MTHIFNGLSGSDSRGAGFSDDEKLILCNKRGGVAHRKPPDKLNKVFLLVNSIENHF